MKIKKLLYMLGTAMVIFCLAFSPALSIAEELAFIDSEIEVVEEPQAIQDDWQEEPTEKLDENAQGQDGDIETVETNGESDMENDEVGLEDEDESSFVTSDAHFFVRYDNTNQEESGDSHYSPTKYFPIGKVADGYEYGSSSSDYTSVDGQVDTDSAYVVGAEGIITQANVNLYNKFDVTRDTIKDYFSAIYGHITEEPSKEVVSQSIFAALGEDWQKAYDAGRVDVVWYVIKPYRESTLINVDGCVYWVKTGDVIDKDDDPDNPKNPDNKEDEKPTPSPEPEPVTPDPEPSTPDVEPSTEDAAKPSSDGNGEVTIKDDEVPLGKATSTLPQTGDEEINHHKILLLLAFASLFLVIVIFVLILKER